MAEAVSGLAHSNTSSSKMGESTSNSSRTIELKRKIRDIEKVI